MSHESGQWEQDGLNRDSIPTGIKSINLIQAKTPSHTSTTLLASSMQLSPTAVFIKSRVEVLIRTDHSVIYTDKAEPDVVLKAETIWINGKPFGPPSMAAQTNHDLCREHDIYIVLGDHQSITRCFGLVYDDNGNAIVLKLGRAAKGNLRHSIEESPEIPTMRRRLEMATAFAKCVVYLHSRGVIWGDLSTRNALVFGDDTIKICDFASSALENVYPQFGIHTYEPAYCPALPEAQVSSLSMMQLPSGRLSTRSLSGNSPTPEAVVTFGTSLRAARFRS